jgi:hypothetical protein
MTDRSAFSAPEQWSIPYTDQDPSFWEELRRGYGANVSEVYFPVRGEILPSGRSPQPETRLDEFLAGSPLPKSVLLNPIVLPCPAEEIAPSVLAELGRLAAEYEIRRVTVADLNLARIIRAALPDFRITLSTLAGISTPLQLEIIGDIADAIVPDSRVLRNLRELETLRRAYAGEIRLMVNEACLPGCPFRFQHFYEMGAGIPMPESLCQTTLAGKPWLRLTGAWVLPRHLHHYNGLYDSLKLAGRVTLRDPRKYMAVLGAYIGRKPILPCDIGGGPASVLEPIDMPDDLFAKILRCDRNCPVCGACIEYYHRAAGTAALPGG